MNSVRAARVFRSNVNVNFSISWQCYRLDHHGWREKPGQLGTMTGNAIFGGTPPVRLPRTYASRYAVPRSRARPIDLRETYVRNGWFFEIAHSARPRSVVQTLCSATGSPLWFTCLSRDHRFGAATRSSPIHGHGKRTRKSKNNFSRSSPLLLGARRT